MTVDSRALTLRHFATGHAPGYGINAQMWAWHMAQPPGWGDWNVDSNHAAIMWHAHVALLEMAQDDIPPSGTP